MTYSGGIQTHDKAIMASMPWGIMGQSTGGAFEYKNLSVCACWLEKYANVIALELNRVTLDWVIWGKLRPRNNRRHAQQLP